MAELKEDLGFMLQPIYDIDSMPYTHCNSGTLIRGIRVLCHQQKPIKNTYTNTQFSKELKETLDQLNWFNQFSSAQAIRTKEIKSRYKIFAFQSK